MRPRRPIDLLKAGKLRTTRQRLALVDLLFRHGDRHVTAERLHEEALGEGVRVSLATVYNTLRRLTRAGFLREVVVEPGPSHFDTNTAHHHHFYYQDRGRLEDIPDDAVAVSSLPAPPPGARIDRVDVIVRLVEDADEKII